MDNPGIKQNYRNMLRGHPEVLDVAQTSRILGVSTKTVYKLIRDGALPALKVGREYRILKPSILLAFSTLTQEKPVFPSLPKK